MVALDGAELLVTVVLARDGRPCSPLFAEFLVMAVVLFDDNTGFGQSAA
jgi:hypothetical protein